jgi:hypothetical protein
MTRPGVLPADDQASLDAILTASPELTAATEHVRAFATLMTESRGRDLEDWMTTATASGEPALQSFVSGLRADQDAVTASRCSNDRCTDAQTPTCSAAASSSPTDLTKTVPQPRFTRRRHIASP